MKLIITLAALVGFATPALSDVEVFANQGKPNCDLYVKAYEQGEKWAKRTKANYEDAWLVFVYRNFDWRDFEVLRTSFDYIRTKDAFTLGFFDSDNEDRGPLTAECMKGNI